VTPNPADMKCTGVALDENTNLTAMVTAGTNCFSSLSVGSGKSKDFTSLAAGLPDRTIYINGGDAYVQGDITCTGCTIVLTNSDPTSTTIGKFKVNASSNINLTAPTDGPFKGIAVFQDRRATDSSPANKINGNSASLITGALYFPNQALEYNGTGNTTATCTMFVAKRIEFTGNSATSNKFKKLADCSTEGLPSNAATRMVRLVG